MRRVATVLAAVRPRRRASSPPSDSSRRAVPGPPPSSRHPRAREDPAFSALSCRTSVTRGYVYILASRRNGTLYVGVTSDLVARIRQHKGDALDGFTKRYGVHSLVYVETHDRIVDAIAREKHLKAWRRAWKLDLIESVNPEWRDLYEVYL